VVWQGSIRSDHWIPHKGFTHLPLSVLEAPVKLAPLSLLVLESVLVVRSLMLLFRDRAPLVLSVLELALLPRSWMLSFRGRFPVLDPGRENAFLTLPHLV
jgi:hypothetical protein